MSYLVLRRRRRICSAARATTSGLAAADVLRHRLRGVTNRAAQLQPAAIGIRVKVNGPSMQLTSTI